MNGVKRSIRSRLIMQAITISIVILLTASARAQGPQFDVGAPPGAAGGASAVGQPLGQANFPDFETPSITPFSGKVGIGGSHVPISGLTVPGVPVFRASGAQAAVASVQPMQTTQYGDLQLSTELEEYGPKDGLTLDAAIERLIQQNLDLEAARFEIPMSDADVLTANLRANPIFYADTQLIPYGHFSFLRPGGPPQSDVNINYPLDITFKRQARTRSAREAKNVTEAQLQDFVRNSIDNLYTVYEDDVAAGLTVKFSEVYATGIRKLQGGRPAGGHGQPAKGGPPAQGSEASEDQGEPRPRPDVELASVGHCAG
jgi:cobalt-zinc-cadmium efflux system outer membrane protein